MNEQVINIFYYLVPILIGLAWLAIGIAFVWGIVRFVRKQKTKRQ